MELFKSFAQNEFAIAVSVSVVVMLLTVIMLIFLGVKAISNAKEKSLRLLKSGTSVRKLKIVKASGGALAFLCFMAASGIVVLTSLAIEEAHGLWENETAIWRDYEAYQAGEMGHEEWLEKWGEQLE